MPIQTTLYIKQINYCIYSVLKLTICLIVPTTYLGRRTESVTRLTRPERAAGNLPSSDPANRISVGAGLCRCHHRRPLRSLPRRTRTEETSRLKQKVGYFCVFLFQEGGGRCRYFTSMLVTYSTLLNLVIYMLILAIFSSEVSDPHRL